MLLFYSEEWSWWFARTTGRLDLTQADAAKSQVHKHTVTLETLLGHWKQWKVASLYYHSANLCIPARTVPDKENWRHGGWQMAITDPLRGSLRQQVQQWDQETRTPWFCYWDNDNLSSIVIFQKKATRAATKLAKLAWLCWVEQLYSQTNEVWTLADRGSGALSCRLSGGFFLVTTCTRCKHQDAICKVAFPTSPSQRLISYQASSSTQCPLILLFHPWEMVLLWKNFTWGSKCYFDRL